MLMLQWKYSQALLFLYLDLFHLKMDKMHAKDAVDVMLRDSAEVWYIGLKKNLKSKFFGN